MILVIGGTGRLGTSLVKRLTNRGQSVRVLARNMNGGPDQPRVEFVAGDVRDRTSLARAVDGVTVVVSAMHGFPGNRRDNPASIDRDGNFNLTDAAARAGADLVMMSVVGASPSHALELFRMKYAAEQHAHRTGLPLTVIRSSAYEELWIDILRQTAGRTGRPIVFGSGRNPINFVSVEDVAVIVDRAVTDASARGLVLQVTGPDTYTMSQLADLVCTTRPGARGPVHVPRSALRIAAAPVGIVNPAVGRQLKAAIAMDTVPLAGASCHLPPGYPTPTTTAHSMLAQADAARALVGKVA